MSAPLSILVVEDSADQWLLIRRMLQECFPQANLVWLDKAEAVLVYLEGCLSDKKKMPKLILSDLYLTHRTKGLTLIAIIKSHAIYRQIPLVTLSWSNHADDVKEAYQHGCNSYIVKPTSYQRWIDCLRVFEHYWQNITTLPDPLTPL